jgi:hypothetical protein
MVCAGLGGVTGCGKDKPSSVGLQSTGITDSSDVDLNALQARMSNEEVISKQLGLMLHAAIQHSPPGQVSKLKVWKSKMNRALICQEQPARCQIERK